MGEYSRRWEEVSQDQASRIFVKETKEELERLKDMIQIPRLPEPDCVVCGKESQIRCSKCKEEFYCSRECQVAHWGKHKKMCKLLCDAARTKVPGAVTSVNAVEEIAGEVVGK